MSKEGTDNRQHSDEATAEGYHVQEQAAENLKHTKNGKEQSWTKLLREWFPYPPDNPHRSFSSLVGGISEFPCSSHWRPIIT